MIEQIFDIDRLREEVENNPRCGVRFILSPEEVEEWKESGKFSFLKKELINIPMKFACTQDENTLGEEECAYYFLCNSEKMAQKLVTMLRDLYIFDRKKPLVKCGYTTAASSVGISGNVKACPLF